MSDISSIGFARYAIEFYEAADAVDKKLGMKKGYEIIAPVPVMYLTGHSIELIFKSYLISKGTTEKELKKINHNLEECYKKAVELGLEAHIKLSNQDIEVLSVLNALYKSKQLNYMAKGYKTFPIMGPLGTLNKKLLQTISPLVGYKHIE